MAFFSFISNFIILYLLSFISSIVLPCLSVAGLVAAAEVIEVLVKNGPAAAASVIASSAVSHALAASVEVSFVERGIIVLAIMKLHRPCKKLGWSMADLIFDRLIDVRVSQPASPLPLDVALVSPASVDLPTPVLSTVKQDRRVCYRPAVSILAPNVARVKKQSAFKLTICPRLVELIALSLEPLPVRAPPIVDQTPQEDVGLLACYDDARSTSAEADSTLVELEKPFVPPTKIDVLATQQFVSSSFVRTRKRSRLLAKLARDDLWLALSSGSLEMDFEHQAYTQDEPQELNYVCLEPASEQAIKAPSGPDVDALPLHDDANAPLLKPKAADAAFRSPVCETSIKTPSKHQLDCDTEAVPSDTTLVDSTTSDIAASPISQFTTSGSEADFDNLAIDDGMKTLVDMFENLEIASKTEFSSTACTASGFQRASAIYAHCESYSTGDLDADRPISVVLPMTKGADYDDVDASRCSNTYAANVEVIMDKPEAEAEAKGFDYGGVYASRWSPTYVPDVQIIVDNIEDEAEDLDVMMDDPEDADVDMEDAKDIDVIMVDAADLDVEMDCCETGMDVDEALLY